jgi:hypothetical protein
MDDLILNDEFKSDKFEVSINELLFSRSYKPTVQSISKLLDNNGYFGRYQIETLTSKKHGTDVLIKIHFYLYDSRFTYTWPYSTFFNIDKKIYGHCRKISRGVLSNGSMLHYVFILLASIFRIKIKNQIEEDSLFDVYSDICLKEISSKKIPVNDWAFIICKIHGNSGQRDYLDKAIPFLCRVGLIYNGKFKIGTTDDADEVYRNLFDINYWHNI